MIERRSLLKGAGAALTTSLFTGRVKGANDRISIAVVGVGGQGFGAHVKGLKKDAKANNIQPVPLETKVRWSRKGMGKSGGLRVIYYNMLEDGTIWLLLIYAKNKHENIPAHLLKAIKEKISCP